MIMYKIGFLYLIEANWLEFKRFEVPDWLWTQLYGERLNQYSILNVPQEHHNQTHLYQNMNITWKWLRTAVIWSGLSSKEFGDSLFFLAIHLKAWSLNMIQITASQEQAHVQVDQHQVCVHEHIYSPFLISIVNIQYVDKTVSFVILTELKGSKINTISINTTGILYMFACAVFSDDLVGNMTGTASYSANPCRRVQGQKVQILS